MTPKHAAGLLALVLAPSLYPQACTFTVSPSVFDFDAFDHAGAVDIFASSPSCARRVISNVPWITISFGDNGTGNGSAGFRIQPNKDPRPRSGTMNIAGVAVIVNQQAATCVYNLNPSSVVISPTGGQGTVGIQTSCNWAVSANVDWIAISQPVSGTGNGSFSYTVSPNNTVATRTATVQVGTAALTVSQPAPSCAITIKPASVNLGSSGGTGSFAISSGCGWTAASSASWIRITGSANGQGNSAVAYSVDPNNSTQSRAGVITVGGQAFAITQSAATCSINLFPASASFPASGGTGSIAVGASCPWATFVSDGWITFSGSTSGAANATLSYAVGSNPSAAPRTATILIGTQPFLVTQAGGACQISLSPPNATLPGAGGTGTFLVAAPISCRWTAAATASWLSVDPASGEGNAVLRYTAAPNVSGSPRTGQISVGAQMFTLAQAAVIPLFSAASVANGASFLAGPVAPGLLVAIFGSNLAPPDLTFAELTSDGLFLATSLGGTKVLFDGDLAPLVYAIEGQVGALVPYSVAGKDTVRVEVEFNGVRSAPVRVAVSPSSPAIFTVDRSGSGPGSILNQDSLLNTAVNPAATGTIVQIYMTGAGQLDPLAIDGRLALDILPKIKLPVLVRIGGKDAAVAYAGSAPGLVSGIIQINAIIPQGLSPGPQPISIRIGDNFTPGGVTVAIR